jgi:hypothetical protein
MSLVICEFGFDLPDAKKTQYSMREVDYYAFIPYVSRIKYSVKNHGLSLRKNLGTGFFEVYRYYYEDDSEEVAFAGSFADALRFANDETNKYWGFLYKREPDVPCEHKLPRIDRWFCPFAVTL